MIHVEQVWQESYLTVEGQHLHERAHESGGETRPGVRIVRRLFLRSDRLRVCGFADVVEFRRSPRREVPFPVEYKRGRRKRWHHDEVQLCAQAFCLEEMIGTEVPFGAIFYGASRRRLDVAFTPELRRLTEEAANDFHRIVAEGVTPPAELAPKCRSCSLRTLCMPELASRPSASDYLKSLYGQEGLGTS